MDQKTIVDALQKALAKGSGDLGDLENLLKRAQQDVIKAREEARIKEEEEKKARGKQIADLANRLLEDEVTDDDCAYVINSWAKKNGLQGKGFTGKELRDIVNSILDARKEGGKVMKELDDMINAFCNTLEKWGDSYNMPHADVKKPQIDNNKDPEDVINKFLKSFGIR